MARTCEGTLSAEISPRTTTWQTQTFNIYLNTLYLSMLTPVLTLRSRCGVCVCLYLLCVCVGVCVGVCACGVVMVFVWVDDSV